MVTVSEIMVQNNKGCGKTCKNCKRKIPWWKRLFDSIERFFTSKKQDPSLAETQDFHIPFINSLLLVATITGSAMVIGGISVRYFMKTPTNTTTFTNSNTSSLHNSPVE